MAFGWRDARRRRSARARPRQSAVAILLAATAVVTTASPLSEVAAQERDDGSPGDLGAAVLQAVRAARFGETIDFGPFEDVCPGAYFCPVPAPPVVHLPNVDIAVIELGRDGQARRATNVLVSRDHPDGIVVPLDHTPGPAGTWGTSAVRWRRWDMERFNGGTFDQYTGWQLSEKGWKDDPPLTGDDDIVEGREDAPIEFMAPYPASLFKLIVAFRMARLVDLGHLTLDDLVSWDPTIHVDEPERIFDLPGATSEALAYEVRTQTVGEWLDAMVSHSDNDATRALLKLLHDLDDLDAMHAELRDLGLGTLQINGTDPASGRLWMPGSIHMTSIDTARLLWLVHGGNGTLWRRPDGGGVEASILSASSRSFLLSLLADQAFHEALSTSNLCGAPHVEPGIPSRVPARWVDLDGTVTVGGYPYGHEVGPCHDAAEVDFAHKTGLTFNYGSNAGIARPLPGQPGHTYVISFIANLGYRYTDEAFASNASYPCYEPVGAICHTQRIPALARRIDAYLRSSG